MRIKFLLVFFLGFLFLCSCNQNTIINNGIRTEYYITGELKSKVSYKDGKKQGFGTWYYKNGMTKVKSHFAGDKHIKESYFYYQNGKLKSYIFFNYESEPIYKLVFDEEENLISEEGKPFTVVFEKNSTVTTDEYFPFYFDFATPPNSMLSFMISDKKEDDSLIIDEIYHVEGEKIPYFKYSYPQSGTKEFAIVSILKDTIRNTLKHDTIKFNLNVRNKTVSE